MQLKIISLYYRICIYGNKSNNYLRALEPIYVKFIYEKKKTIEIIFVKFNLNFHDNELLENLFTFGILFIYFTEHFIHFMEQNIF